MKLPRFSCFKKGAQEASPAVAKIRNRAGSKDSVSADSTASTADSEAVLPKLSGSFINADTEKPLERIPDIRKEREWFDYWDVHRLGMLSKREAIEALQKTFGSFNPQKLTLVIDALWPEFDKDGSGLIGREAMLRKQTGLVDTALYKYQLALTIRTHTA